MARIHPNTSSIDHHDISSKLETFTVWMKSLVFNGNGCTVFNDRGQLVFRVDNYQKRCSSKVFLMDSTGKTLFSIYRKRHRIFSCWEGFNNKQLQEKPWFQVRRNNILSIFRKDVSCKVILKNSKSSYEYRIVGLEAGKSALKIIDCSSGHILAQAMEKQSSDGGVGLGEDVLTLMVEPLAPDQPLIMALLTVYGLINNKL